MPPEELEETGKYNTEGDTEPAGLPGARSHCPKGQHGVGTPGLDQQEPMLRPGPTTSLNSYTVLLHQAHPRWLASHWRVLGPSCEACSVRSGPGDQKL